MNCYHRSIYDVLYESGIYSMPIYVALLCAVLWIIIRKMIELKRSSDSSFTNKEQQASLPATASPLYMRYIDNAVFYIVAIGLVGGTIFLKIGQHWQEKEKKRLLLSGVTYHRAHCAMKDSCNISVGYKRGNSIKLCGSNECRKMGIDSSCLVDILCDSTGVK
jgi:hypothetical protein